MRSPEVLGVRALSLNGFYYGKSQPELQREYKKKSPIRKDRAHFL